MHALLLSFMSPMIASHCSRSTSANQLVLHASAAARDEASGGQPVLQPPTGHGNHRAPLARATAIRRKKKERSGWRKKKREAAPLHPFLASSLGSN
jgi:hypothetical protein